MSDVLDFLLGLALLVFCAYVLIFGGIGALLARHRGGSPAMGFVVGLVPLIGWPLVLILTRSGRRAISADDWLEETSSQVTQAGGMSQPSLAPGTPVSPPTAGDPHDY